MLAAIALLGLLLSATLVAIGRHTRQARRAQDRVAAIDLADGLLHQWLVEQNGQIDSNAGTIASRPGWRWRLKGRRDTDLERFGAHIGKLSIYRASESPPTDPLATLEFVSTSSVTAPTEGVSR